MRFQPFRSRGSALLLTLWAVIFVAICVASVLAIVQGDIDEAISLNEQLQAHQIAKSGIILGTHPQIVPGDSILKGRSELGGTYEVNIVSESARLDINQIVRGGQSDVLKNLLSIWGLTSTEISTVVDSLQDWSTPNGSQRLHGAGEAYYEGLDVGTLPLDRTFSRVQDIRIINGMDIVAAKKPNWADYFTIWSNGARIDLNDASADLVSAASGVSISRAEDFVSYRSRMKTAENPEARRWTTISEPLIVLGIAPGTRPDIEDRVTVSGEIWRVESKAWVGHQQCVLGVIIKHGSSDVIYRYEK